MDLLDLRNQIDKIDGEIVRLFEERMDVCSEVAKYKIETGKAVFDKEREKEKIKKVKSLASNELNETGIEDLFGQIMAVSRKLQYGLLSERGITGMPDKLSFDEAESLNTDDVTVVFQGACGAYSEAATIKYFGENVKRFHVDTFRDAMESVKEGKADFAILPIENSTAGSVEGIYDLLSEYSNYIVGEEIIKIEHCLMAVPGTDINDIKRVYSHPQSLMQSDKYLKNQPWQQISMQNNAFAARKVAEDKDKSQAAIASEYAAKLYGLEILKKGVNNTTTNSTRFIICAGKRVYLRDADKISITVEAKDESGSLYKILSHFIYNNLNMTRIESRPIDGKDWGYRFFIDFEGNLSDSAVKNCLLGLYDEAENMKILGCFKARK